MLSIGAVRYPDGSGNDSLCLSLVHHLFSPPRSPSLPVLFCLCDVLVSTLSSFVRVSVSMCCGAVLSRKEVFALQEKHHKQTLERGVACVTVSVSLLLSSSLSHDVYV